MKKFSLIIMALFLAIGVNSCSDDDSLDLTVQPDPEGLNFTSNFSAQYILTNSTGSNLAERFVWNEVDLGLPTDVTYEVQGSADADFAEMAPPLASTNETNAGITVAQLLSLAGDAELDNDPATTITDADGNEIANNSGIVYVRLRAFAGNGNANTVEQFSDVQELNIFLPENVGEEEDVVLPQLFLVGDATAVGYNNNANNPAFVRNPDNENEFSYTGRFLADGTGFKFLEIRGQWQPQWGLTDGSAAVNDGSGNDPDPVTVSSEGYYTVTLNKDVPEISVEAYDAASAPTYTSIAIIGTARTEGGFDAPDTDMTQSDFDPHIWQIQNVELIDGELKFRANDAWDVNWGNNTANSGFGTMGGPNIPVVEGTYEIWFNDLTGGYIFVPVTE
ncbi:MAG: SusF/SusE family outer membrane protein [Leeuwenhoekiella sp.]